MLLQDNEPLIRTLSSLIVLNAPDLVLGEALMSSTVIRCDLDTECVVQHGPDKLKASCLQGACRTTSRSCAPSAA